MVLASQIAWSESCENALQTISSSSNQNDLEPVLRVLRVVEATLNILADSVLQEQPPVRRRKLEHLVSKLLLISYISCFLQFQENSAFLSEGDWNFASKCALCVTLWLDFSTPKGYPSQNSRKFLNLIWKMQKHKILPFESAAKEFSFEW